MDKESISNFVNECIEKANPKDNQDSSIRKSKQKLSVFLKNYKVKFSKDLDEMWEQYDVNQNGQLGKDEALKFIQALSTCINS